MSNRSAILIIFTGGTIGMIKKVNNYVPINFKELVKYFPELDKLNYYLEIIGFNPPIDSAEMSPKIWIKIVEIIEKNYKRAPPRCPRSLLPTHVLSHQPLNTFFDYQNHPNSLNHCESSESYREA